MFSSPPTPQNIYALESQFSPYIRQQSITMRSIPKYSFIGCENLIINLLKLAVFPKKAVAFRCLFLLSI